VSSLSMVLLWNGEEEGPEGEKRNFCSTFGPGMAICQFDEQNLVPLGGSKKI